jgi:hypothetical protein
MIQSQEQISLTTTGYMGRKQLDLLPYADRKGFRISITGRALRFKRGFFKGVKDVLDKKRDKSKGT